MAPAPVYASHGGADGMVDVAWGRATTERLKARGFDVRFTEHDGLDHELGERQARFCCVCVLFAFFCLFFFCHFSFVLFFFCGIALIVELYYLYVANIKKNQRSFDGLLTYMLRVYVLCAAAFKPLHPNSSSGVCLFFLMRGKARTISIPVSDIVVRFCCCCGRASPSDCGAVGLDIGGCRASGVWTTAVCAA